MCGCLVGILWRCCAIYICGADWLVFLFGFLLTHHKINQNKIDVTADGGGEESEEANAAAQLAMVDQVDDTKFK